MAARFLLGAMGDRQALARQRASIRSAFRISESTARSPGIVGAKLLMFVFDFDYYRAKSREAFSLATLQAGGVFFGGLVIAILAVRG